MKQDVIYKSTVNGTSGGKSIPWSVNLPTDPEQLHLVADYEDHHKHLRAKRSSWFRKMFPVITVHGPTPPLQLYDFLGMNPGTILLLTMPGSNPVICTFVRANTGLPLDVVIFIPNQGHAAVEREYWKYLSIHKTKKA